MSNSTYGRKTVSITFWFDFWGLWTKAWICLRWSCFDCESHRIFLKKVKRVLVRSEYFLYIIQSTVAYKDEIMWLKEDGEIEISLREVNMTMTLSSWTIENSSQTRQIWQVQCSWRMNKKLSRPINHKNSWIYIIYFVKSPQFYFWVVEITTETTIMHLFFFTVYQCVHLSPFSPIPLIHKL